jgi:hypothetical protein
MAISAASAGVEYDYERLELLGEHLPHCSVTIHSHDVTVTRRCIPKIPILHICVCH